MHTTLSMILSATLLLIPLSDQTHARSSAKPANALEELVQRVFVARNPKVTHAKVLELRSIGMGAGPYVLLATGIRPDRKFEGAMDDEIFGVFILDNNLTRIERTIDIFPTCRWADCIVTIEKVTWSGSEIIVSGHGSSGDSPFRKAYTVARSQ